MIIFKKYPRCILNGSIAFCLFLILILINGCRKTTVYHIGFMGPLNSGEAAYDSIGVIQSKAVEMAVADFNTEQEVHGYQIELIVKDSKGDPEFAVKATKEMLQEDKILALLGPLYSSVALKVSDPLLRAQVPMVSAAAAYSQLTAKSRYIFRTGVSNLMYAKVLGPYIVNILNHRSMAILYTNNIYSMPLAQDVAKVYERAGGKITLSLRTERKRKEYRDELERLRLTRPESLFLPTQLARHLNNAERYSGNGLEYTRFQWECISYR